MGTRASGVPIYVLAGVVGVLIAVLSYEPVSKALEEPEPVPFIEGD
jgi:hypothetical protein